uniref:Uncharacterized protein n=1 Tax=Pelusios castaneus TaxID=367368 RepID=A0A8C8R699_9SAUR
MLTSTTAYSSLLSPAMAKGAGNSVGSDRLFVPRSMLPDAVDDFRLKNPNCLNLEALFYSFYVFFNKFAGGLSLGISTMSLHFAGYSTSDCTPNHSVILTLRVLMAPVPIILLLIAMLIFYFYPINEERRKLVFSTLRCQLGSSECFGRRLNWEASGGITSLASSDGLVR